MSMPPVHEPAPPADLDLDRALNALQAALGSTLTVCRQRGTRGLCQLMAFMLRECYLISGELMRRRR